MVLKCDRQPDRHTDNTARARYKYEASENRFAGPVRCSLSTTLTLYCSGVFRISDVEGGGVYWKGWAPPPKKISFVPKMIRFAAFWQKRGQCLGTRILRFSRETKFTTKHCKHYPKIHGQTKGVVALSPIRNTPPTVLDQYKLTYSVIHSGVARILIQEGTACMLTKSGRNHRSIYINRINCKAENCQIGVNALAPGGTCPVPHAPWLVTPIMLINALCMVHFRLHFLPDMPKLALLTFAR